MLKQTAKGFSLALWFAWPLAGRHSSPMLPAGRLAACAGTSGSRLTLETNNDDYGRDATSQVSFLATAGTE